MLKVRRPLVKEGALAEDWFHKGLHKALKINSSFRRSFGAQRSSALGPQCFNCRNNPLKLCESAKPILSVKRSNNFVKWIPPSSTQR